jgi:murein peptide amidase A
VAQAAGAEVRQFAQAGVIPLLVIETRAAVDGEPLIYLSSGVHGDESGAAAGLLAWAEENVEALKNRSFLIFPCLNPHGLMLNTRVDHRGLDLNRRFHIEDDEVCGPWHTEIAGREMVAGLCLHEDYDAEGAYVYELGLQREAISHDILKKCERIIPHDRRKKIDGRAAVDGVIRRRKIPQDLPGMPEAIVLHWKGCPVTLTFETPSEFSLDLRVAAQREFIGVAIRKFA